MKKRIIGIVLACFMVLPLATFQVGASSEDAKTISISELPEKAQLESLLNWLEIYLSFCNDDINHEHDFDCRNVTEKYGNIFEYLVRLPRSEDEDPSYYGDNYRDTAWDIYPGKRSKAGGLESNYSSMSDKMRIDWIMLNVLNCSQTDLNTLRDIAISKVEDWGYYDNNGKRIENYVRAVRESNGFYYGSSLQIGWEQSWDRFDFLTVKYDGTFYYIKYHPYCDLIDDVTFSDQYATLGLKTIDGKQYWSIFANSSDGFISFSSVGGFYDVQEGDWFAEPVLWAVEKGITNGTSSNQFSPGQTCTTAQILTFLWRTAGSPEPGIQNPFTDVKTSDYFYKAAVWAAEKGLVSGSKFNGATPCTRSATVTYLWKLSGSPAAGSGTFADVSASAPYSQAVAWAVDKGVTSGTGNNKFSPDETCTRGQIVTFLYRWTHL